MEAVLGILLGFGLVVVLPIVIVLTKHQRKMTELIHKDRPAQSDEVLSRLDALQRQMNEMQDRQNELILEKHDQLPPPSPRVEDRIRDGG